MVGIPKQAMGIPFPHLVTEASHHRRIEQRNDVERACEFAEENMEIRKRMIFLLYYRHGYSYYAIGKLIQRSEGQVSRIIKKILKKMASMDKVMRQKKATCRRY